MRGTCGLILSAIVGTAIAVAGCAPAWAGIINVSDGRVDLIENPEQLSHAATPFAPFDDTISKSGSFTNSQGVTSNYSASASQKSTLSLSSTSLHLSADGNVSFTNNGDALTQLGIDGVTTESAVYISFTVTTPATYKVTESTSDQTVNSPTRVETSDGAFLFDFQHTGPLGGPKNLLPYPLENQPPVTFTGTLTPGNYLLQGLASGGALASQTQNADISSTASFSLDLMVTTTGTEAVPLPPALWMALLTMVVAIPAIHVLRRRTNGK